MDASGATSLTSAAQTVMVLAPVIDPVVTLASVLPATIKPNGIGSVLITITNAGNIAAGILDLTLSLSTDGVATAGSPLRTVRIALSIPAMQSRRFRLAFRVPRTAAPGSFHVIASSTLGGVTAAVAATSSVFAIS